MAAAHLWTPPHDFKTTQEFTFHNLAHHRDIAAALFRLNGTILPIFPIAYLPHTDRSGWLRWHANMHIAMNRALSLASKDLSIVDFENTAQLSHWTSSHAQEHITVGNLLGIG